MKTKISFTPEYVKCLSELLKKGKVGRKVREEADALMAQISMHGEAQTFTPTKWGETRVPNCLKYDLTDYYRVVTQSVSSGNKTYRVFLWVADKGDTERWLNNHRGYRWIKNEKDGTLDFIQITDVADRRPLLPSHEALVPDAVADTPLLAFVLPEEWDASGLSEDLRDYLSSITRSKYQLDPNGILEHVEQVADLDSALFAGDILDMAQRGDAAGVKQRIQLFTGGAAVVDGAEFVKAIQEPQNSEIVLTWDDNGPPLDMNWEDWMLFLRPIQAELAVKSLNGPARIRGVSGSGKTTVVVHRARYLAHKYREKRVLLATLTESTRKLLDQLVSALCGVERTYVVTTTVSAYVLNVLECLAPEVAKRRFYRIETGRQYDCINAAADAIRMDVHFGRSSLAALPDAELKRFVEEEVAFVRARLLPEQYDEYLAMARRGRGRQLAEDGRRAVLSAVRAWDRSLEERRVADHAMVAQLALQTLESTTTNPNDCVNAESLRYRCVLVDEVQDLSEIELRVLAKTMSPCGERVVDLSDGLFLVGDGAQSIYNKSFSLKQCGIVVRNRSWVLKKNYRNTRQILEAAFGLIERHEFTDTDEEEFAKPSQPDFSSRQGEKPWIVKCGSPQQEAQFVVSVIRKLREERALSDEAKGFEEASAFPVCVIGFTPRDREYCETELNQAGLNAVELRDDIGWLNDAVKISTLESAKGHEFEVVFLVGLRDGVLPREGESLTREASRMYVAMTRARERLFLSYTVSSGGKPSEFLAEVQPYCDEYEWRNGVLQRQR